MTTNTSNLSEVRFRTILADPPWDIQQKGVRGAEMHYDLMSLAQIKEMPIADLAEADAHLWLWVTNATLRHGYDVAEAWGFTVRSPLTWIKFRLGLGNYLRNVACHEHGTGVAGFLPGSWDHLDCQSWDHPACLAGGSWVSSLDRRVGVAVMEVYGRGIQGGQCG